MPAPKTSLSTFRPPSTPPPTLSTYENKNLSHAPNLKPLLSAQKKICDVKPLSIAVNDHLSGTVPAFLHIPQNYHNEQQTQDPSKRTAAILLSGASGGVVGPSSIYLSIADKLAGLNNGIPVLRLDYRYPARNKYCIADVQAAMHHLSAHHSISRFILVGWSFGGGPAFTLGGSDSRVIACATIASQTASTEGIEKMAPKPVLLLHGTGDRTLSWECSRRLWEWYGELGERELRLFEGDDHSLRRNARVAEEVLCRFVIRCAGVGVEGGEGEVVREDLVGNGERVELMRKGGVLGGEEGVE